MHPIKPTLDKISPSFCMAKWLQVTIRLQNGHTHSCHHPKPHKVSTEELNLNPSALHNTQVKKQARKQMLEGERPKECNYCWKVEDLPGNQISDRFYKSADPWAEPFIQEVKSLPWNSNVNPKYIEVSFSNICNFKCAYCFPDVSSKWMSEVIEHGAYPTSDFFGSLIYVKRQGTMPIPEKVNPYLPAFWKWLPEVSPGLLVLRVTGGEPLLSKDCKRLIEYLGMQFNPHLSFNLNTNLGVPTVVVKESIGNIGKLVSEKKIKDAHIYTSVDTWGAQAEYIRYGMDLNLWKRNLALCFQESDQIRVTIMVTFNALSVFSFKDFLKFVLEQKKKYGSRIMIDVSILDTPLFLSVHILDESHANLVRECIDYMKANADSFIAYEISKMERLHEFMKQRLPEKEVKKRRQNFVSYIEEYDRRKKTNFFATFPEMQSTFKKWKMDADFQLKYLRVKVKLANYLQKIFLASLLSDKPKNHSAYSPPQ